MPEKLVSTPLLSFTVEYVIRSVGGSAMLQRFYDWFEANTRDYVVYLEHEIKMGSSFEYFLGWCDMSVEPAHYVAGRLETNRYDLSKLWYAAETHQDHSKVKQFSESAVVTEAMKQFEAHLRGNYNSKNAVNKWAYKMRDEHKRAGSSPNKYTYIFDI